MNVLYTEGEDITSFVQFDHSYNILVPLNNQWTKDVILLTIENATPLYEWTRPTNVSHAIKRSLEMVSDYVVDTGAILNTISMILMVTESNFTVAECSALYQRFQSNGIDLVTVLMTNDTITKHQRNEAQYSKYAPFACLVQY